MDISKRLDELIEKMGKEEKLKRIVIENDDKPVRYNFHFH